jgi:GNAT superfamily N-acetyltransferase
MQVVDLTDEHVHFVAACTHVDDANEEIESAATVRAAWLKDNLLKGLRVKVAVDNGKPVGFAHCLPIELGTWGMSGSDLMTVPCLTLKYSYVYGQKRGSGYGRALIEAVESEARKTKKGVAVLAYDNDFWFMPASFFMRLGYRQVSKQGDTVIMLKTFEPVEHPVMHRLNYQPNLVLGKVVVDAFWNPICQTSLVEIIRIREVCAEYGDNLILNEYNCGDKDVLEQYQTERAIFINGELKGWGYEAPKDGLRQEIESAEDVSMQS